MLYFIVTPESGVITLKRHEHFFCTQADKLTFGLLHVPWLNLDNHVGQLHWAKLGH
jgi:hypothetical protein